MTPDNGSKAAVTSASFLETNRLVVEANKFLASYGYDFPTEIADALKLSDIKDPRLYTELNREEEDKFLNSFKPEPSETVLDRLEAYTLQLLIDRLSTLGFLKQSEISSDSFGADGNVSDSLDFDEPPSSSSANLVKNPKP